MNKGATSREYIMQVCRKIASAQGLETLTMRRVARECGIALGTLYNYYSDKDELLIAAVESIWREIFHGNECCSTGVSFPDHVSRLFKRARDGADKYPDFITAHSMVLAKSQKRQAKNAMEQYFDHMKSEMLTVLQADPQVNATAFSPSFLQSDFIDFVMDNILLLLIKESESCAVLIGIIRRMIYRQ